TLRQHFLNFSSDELPIVRVYEGHVFRDRWRLAARIEAMDREQLRRPVVETSRVECPAAGVRQPLSLRQIELGLLALLNIEINPDPILHRSIGRSERLDSAEEPAVIALSVPNSTTRRSGASRPQIVRPDSPHFFVI